MGATEKIRLYLYFENVGVGDVYRPSQTLGRPDITLETAIEAHSDSPFLRENVGRVRQTLDGIDLSFAGSLAVSRSRPLLTRLHSPCPFCSRI